MRIGIDATICYNSTPTGLGVYAKEIVNAIGEMHDDLVVWTINDNGMKVGKNRIRKVMHASQIVGKFGYLFRPFWLAAVLPKLIQKEKIDVLFSTVPSALKEPAVPHIVCVHDAIPLACPDEVSFPVRWNYRHNIPRILTNASALITNSCWTRNDIQRFYKIDPQRIRAIYLGYDRSFKPCHDPKILDRYGLEANGYLLYVGNTSPRKNLARLIHSYVQAATEIRQKLVLCGTKNQTEITKLKELVSRYNLGGRVVLLDYVPHSELPALYSGAALFVYVSLYEGFGLPILEAMACGTPVLASKTTSIPEVAGNAAVLIDPTNCDSIAHSIKKIILDPNCHRSLADAGLKRCSEFSWNKTAEETLSLIKSVFHQQSGRGIH